MNDSTINTLNVDITETNFDQHSNSHTKCDVSTQVNLNISSNNNFIFECIQNKNNVNTQVSVPTSFDNNFSRPRLLDKMCEPDSNNISCLSCESFKGLESIKNEILETYSIASVCIHIERVFAQIKMYGILNKLKINLLSYADYIVHICCVLTNLQLPIIKS